MFSSHCMTIARDTCEIENPLAHVQGIFNASIPFEEALQFYLYLLFFLQF